MKVNEGDEFMKKSNLVQWAAITLVSVGSLGMLNGCSKDSAKTAQPADGGQGSPTMAAAPAQADASASGNATNSGVTPVSSSATLSQVTCSGVDACNASVGLLSVTANGQTNHCTAFLSSPTEIMTSVQCLPAGTGVGALASGEVLISFPGLTGDQNHGAAVSEEALNVTSVISIDASGYASLLLEQAIADRAPLPLSLDGFPINSSFIVTSIATSESSASGDSSGALAGVMSSVHCETAMNSAALPAYDQNETEQSALAGCTLSAEAEGAPVMSLDGSVRGVVSHSIAAVSELGQKFADEKIMISDKLDAIYAVSNLGCSAELNQGSAPESCASQTVQSFPGTASELGAHLPSDVVAKYHKEVAEKVKAIAINKSSTKSVFVWKEISLPKPADFIEASDIQAGEHFAIPVPSCIHRADLWVKKYTSKGVVEKEASERQIISAYKGDFGYSSSLVIAEKISTVKRPLYARVSFDAESLAKKGSGTVNVHLANLQDKAEFVYTGEVSLCNEPKAEALDSHSFSE
jgi:hypothetical protein